MSNRYADELKKEKQIIEESNPLFKKFTTENQQQKDGIRSVPFTTKKDRSGNYFHMILSSDFEDLEMEIRGLRYYKDIDVNGKEILVTRKVENHYLSEEGAEDLLLELKGHLSSDIKLGVMTRDEFLMMQDIIRKFLVSYITNNLYKLGMDTEEKQRKSPTLIVMMLSRIRAVYSRSIAGLENERSHGDIKLSGDLDFGRNDPFMYGGNFGSMKGLKELKN